MSGLVALLARDGAPLDPDLLARMTAAQRFRGPDGEGTWVEGPAGLGHTLHRCSLEATREVQPATLDGRRYVAADARIDARAELCRKLRARGVEASEDAPDPELILQAYAAWGTSCVEHLLGDFSFALWDAPNRRLLCAVDPLGVKPLFYADRGGLFGASNSLQPLHLHPGVTEALDESALRDFLIWGQALERDTTIFRDVRRLPPGHRLVLEAGSSRLERYYTLPEAEEVRWSREADCVEAFRELFDAAVGDRLRTPCVGISLSGGLDSPLVAESARRQLELQFGAAYRLEAMTVGFEHLIPDDERHFAGRVADSLRIPLRFVAADDDPLFDVAWLQSRPEPSSGTGGQGAGRAFRELCARCPVVLDGFDGDALFRAVPALHWKQRLRERRLADLSRELGWYVRTQRGLPPIGFRNALQARREARSRPALPAWLRADRALEQRWDDAFQVPLASGPRAPSRHNFLNPAWGDLFTWMDAGHGDVPVEQRHPLADLRIVRFALGLPTIPWCIDKELLRRAAGCLPEEVRRRPKTPLHSDPRVETFARQGLGVPARVWSHEALDAYVDVKLLDSYLSAARPGDGLHAALHAVALGIWLAGPRGSRFSSHSQHARF